MFKYEEFKTIPKLEMLSIRAKSAFAIACASRLVPAYKEHAIENNLKYDEFEMRMNSIWNFVKYGTKLISRIAESEMDTFTSEDRGSCDLSFLASDAAASLVYASWTAYDGSTQASAWAARRAYEAFDWVAQQRNSTCENKFREEMLLSDPLVQAELMEQANDLQDLLSNGDATDFASMQDRAVRGRVNMVAALAVVRASRE